MKKIEQGALFLQRHLALFKCPICGEAFREVVGYQLVCQLDHSFDLSRKGTLFMITHKVKSEYDSPEMWQARRKMLTLGLFDPIIAAINEAMPVEEKLNILDIGSGEGTPPAKLKKLRAGIEDTLVGVDISKSAVNLATSYQNDNFFCVADLAALPFADQSFDCITDIFSPAAYHEFKRVLRPHGKIYKIVPNSGYLKELRALLYNEESAHRTYDNSAVLSLFAKNFPDYQKQDIKYTFEFSETDFSSLLMMTPLNWGASQQTKQNVLETPLKQITVDVSLLTAAKQ
ncbi:23S rRNA m(1)G 745 methyltransferase [Ligilactobacillus acidipiscis DSM 15836]|jgi:23S rRNA (guanine745-N1)-methyltransferase|uniref:Methyltransferase domain-containing protein n=2 Tax=Ligilactobacillus acidipiscis TaxID=89059 RepID=A0A921F8W9_9LACO|nr:methyltransferase domain-containing protein [Ligilactobacillus acidipiscis]KRM27692.1 23S rRNA m(1)G 745 methyltransferase [Ligilactobacillus acidipiscis DSM 15836]MCI1924186.1 methyltransferase domain-containing protein [Ligilactobacillus acidipiscis]MCI1953588.1 methyltransferase domain-containing protein [Ligilactobacillus acidipiscis]GAW63119.1 23S rRNA methyltransferase [Ligilactobacillus acidipiscis]GEN21263.1 23S rRNA methyltransferase [Ligilactobacillus acidipiscis]